MRDPETHGPLYRTTDTSDAAIAWEADDTQWILSDGMTYLVGYAPAIFRAGPMAQGWHMSSPEQLRPSIFAA
jgi:hypothetical protein